MKFESFISKRYLFSRQNTMLASIITIISILGVTVGVTALICVISVMDGFDNELVRKMMGAFSHIRVWNSFDDRIANYDELMKIISEDPEVAGVSPVLATQAFLQADTGISANKVGIQLLGIDLEKEKTVTDYGKNITAGKGDPASREIVLGEQLSQRLHAFVGSPLYAITRLTKTPNGPMPKTASLRVAGTYKTGLYDVDANTAYCSLQTIRDICLINENSVDYVQIKLKDPFKIKEYEKKIKHKLGGGYVFQTWDELNRDFFIALKLEKLVMFIILMLIVVVAAFNIIGTLIMVTSQKTREIGMLKSMGVKNKSILKIFILHGTFIGVVGTSLGVILGIVCCYVLEHYIAYQLPAAVYGLQTLPVDVQFSTVAVIVLSSMFVCSVSSIIPAWQASKLHPVEALRHE